jgi:RNA polymerase sigma factor (sigma-70 family)
MSSYDASVGAGLSVVAKSPDDAMLVMAAKSGEHHAFVELFNRHSAKVLRTTYKITKNYPDAEDAMQDAFLNAYLHINAFDGRAQFSSWLLRIAINSSLIILRRKRIRPETSIDSIMADDTSHGWDPVDRSIDVEAHYVVQERAVRLRKAIHRLRPNLRNVVEIQQRYDGSLKETAEIANLSVAATKSRLLRAKQVLRRTMNLAPRMESSSANLFQA